MNNQKSGWQHLTLAYICFTDRGETLAYRLAKLTGGSVSRCRSRKCIDDNPEKDIESAADEHAEYVRLDEWTQEHFHKSDGLVYVGAAGIAVRAVAPYVAAKTSDPAVVVIDECGKFVISLLSGHLGGANELTGRIAAVSGAVPVITTATDINGIFAVDEWAKRQNCHIVNPQRIKYVSGALLSGQTIKIKSFVHVKGGLPPGVEITDDDNEADVIMDIADYPAADSLRLIPRIAVLGVGCRRGTTCKQLEKKFKELLQETGIAESAFCCAASIDLKKDEEGLLEFCEKRRLEFRTYTQEELGNVSGEFSSSEFVKKTVGVDNVCERSAAAASQGNLYYRKISGDGVTMAVALKPFKPDWRYEYE